MKLFLTITSFFVALFFLFAEVMVLLFAINNLHYAYYYLVAGLVSAGLLFIPAKSSDNKFVTGFIYIMKILIWVMLGIGLIMTLLSIWLKMSY